MKNIIAVIAIIIVLVLIFSYTFQFIKNVSQGLNFTFEKKEISEKKPISKQTKQSPVIKSKNIKTGSLIDTSIISGPKQGEIINNTNEIVFEWEAKDFSKELEKEIKFETKVEGIDDNWKSTSSKKRIIKFPAGQKEYKFLVRAKTNNLIDLTPASRTFKINISPYFGKLRISGAKEKTSSHPSQIILSSNIDEKERINITNWSIKGYKGEITIPQGIEKYQPYGIVNDVFIDKNDKVYLLSGNSPFGANKNFRLNKCFGYYSNYQSFYPSFSKSCPKATYENLSDLNQYCQEFILDLSTCEIPNYSNNYNVSSNYNCTSYIQDNFNYTGCLKHHSQDKDFLKNYWYVYLSSNIVSDYRDTLYMYDKNNLFVNKYKYRY